MLYDQDSFSYTHEMNSVNMINIVIWTMSTVSCYCTSNPTSIDSNCMLISSIENYNIILMRMSKELSANNPVKSFNHSSIFS
ncbi:unnamed protein product [Chironomus riparius]|uniref:Uncharacterized protein n=1 Tax=Chironomus riparius TaxID=315576 RepID=A0A9N9WWM1_9DIPT|nr:unnamed protein product [Chironomus riparius]